MTPEELEKAIAMLRSGQQRQESRYRALSRRLDKLEEHVHVPGALEQDAFDAPPPADDAPMGLPMDRRALNRPWPEESP